MYNFVFYRAGHHLTPIRSRLGGSSTLLPIDHTAVDVPYHVITNEVFHQLRSVGIQKSTHCLKENLLFVSKPTFPDQRHGAFIIFRRAYHNILNLSFGFIAPGK